MPRVATSKSLLRWFRHRLSGPQFEPVCRVATVKLRSSLAGISSWPRGRSRPNAGNHAPLLNRKYSVCYARRLIQAVRRTLYAALLQESICCGRDFFAKLFVKNIQDIEYQRTFIDIPELIAPSESVSIRWLCSIVLVIGMRWVSPLFVVRRQKIENVSLRLRKKRDTA